MIDKSTKNNIKFAVVGCGRIAKRHSDLLGLSQVKGAELVAVCDLDQLKARPLADKFAIPFYVDMHEMMSSVLIDVVVVLTESGNHAQHVIDLAGYGKHIIVEKPMALRLSDADNMIKACQHAGVELFVVKQNRFNVPVVKLRQALEEGRFGKLILGTVRVRWCRTQDYYDQDDWRGTWRYDGGVLANQASHHVDLLEWMLGGVESVFAKSINALAEIEAEDTIVATLKFKNGALGVIEATTATRPRDLEGSISILGERGVVEIGGFAVNEMKTWSFMGEEDEVDLEGYSVNPPNVYGYGHQSFYEHVVATLSGLQSNLFGGEVGRKSLELIHAIYESAATGKEVSLDSEFSSSRLGN